MPVPQLSGLLNWVNGDTTAVEVVDERRQLSGQEAGTTRNATNDIDGRNQATNNTELAAAATGQEDLQGFSETSEARSQPATFPGFLQGLGERSESNSRYPSDLEVLDSDSDAWYEFDDIYNPVGIDLTISVPDDLMSYGSVERALFRLMDTFDEYRNVCTLVYDIQDVFYMLCRWLEFLWSMRRQRGTPPIALSWRIEEVVWMLEVLVRVLVCRQGGGWRAPRTLRIQR